MSLRSVGNQLLQTVPNALLAEASVASLSLWVRANAANNVVNSNGVEIFGDSGGKLSATLSGAGSLLVQWLSQSGTTNGSSSYELTLVPGSNYHVATTWQAGAQSYYLNGVLVHTDTQVGSIGVVGDSAPHPYRLGSDSLGTDVTLDEPTIWVGYALSAQDVLNLRDRVGPPQTVAPSSIALQWSLAGADGIAAQVGDAGLTDTSSTHLNLSSIVGTAPTYQAGVLSYYPPVTASVTPSGEAIALQFQDGSGNPINLSTVAPRDDIQTIEIAAEPAGSAFTLTFNGQTTSPLAVAATPPPSYVLWTLSAPVGVAVQLADTWPEGVGPFLGGCDLYYEVFDGSNATTALYAGEASQHVSPSDFTYGTYGDSTPVPWHIIGGPGQTFTSTTGTLIARISATNLDNVYYDAIQVKNLTTGTTTIFDDQDGSLVYHGSDTFTTNSGHTSGNYASVDGTYSQTVGRGLGPVYVATGGAAAIQAALLALSSVQAAGLTVAGSNPYVVTFSGPMGGIDQPLITCSDSAVSIAHTNPGGNVPEYSSDGGSTWLPLTMIPVWSTQFDQVIYNFPQATPQFQFSESGWNAYFSQSGFNDDAPGSSLSGRPAQGPGGVPGSFVSFAWDRLTPATYRAAVTWQADPSLSTDAQFEVRDKAGNVLVGPISVDLTVAPSDFTNGGFGYKIIGSHTIVLGDGNTGLGIFMLSEGSTGQLVADAAILERTSADESVNFTADDTVQVRIPAGCIATAVGPVPASTITLANLVGGSLLGPFDAVPKTMLVGNNIEQDGSACSLYSDLARRISTPMAPARSGAVLASNSDGYPTLIDGPRVLAVTVVVPTTDIGGIGKGLAGPPAGLWTLIWDGASDVQAEPSQNGTVTEVASYHNYTGTTGNVRVYNCQGTILQFTPDFAIDIYGVGSPDQDGHYAVSLSNLHVYPPDPSDPTGATPWGITQVGGVWVTTGTVPTWHPNNASRLGATTISRFMDVNSINDSVIADFSDFPPTSNLSRVSFKLTVSDIVSITNVPDDIPVHFCIQNFTTSLVTTATPHNLFNRAGDVYFQGGGTATYTDGSHATFDGFLPNVVWVVDDFRFLMNYSRNNPDGSQAAKGNPAMVSPVGAGGTVQVTRGSKMPIEDQVGFCNAYGQHLYWNMSICETDDCTNAQIAYITANLWAGARIYLELGNELWNNRTKVCYGALEISYQYQLTLPGATPWSPTNTGGVTDVSYQPGYINQHIEKMALWSAGWVAAGRSPSNLFRCLGVSGDPGGSGNSVLLNAQQQGAAFERVAVASYFDNIVPGTLAPFAYISDTMTVAQAMDQYEAVALQGLVFGIITTDYNNLLATYGYPDAKLINYEGSLQAGNPNGTSADDQRFATIVGRHPRAMRVELARLQAMQDGNTAESLIYYWNGPPQPDQNWANWVGFNQQPGTGTDADTYNLNDPFNTPYILSEPGGAQHTWASLVAGPPPTPPSPKQLVPGRNGQLKTTGFSKRANELTR